LITNILSQFCGGRLASGSMSLLDAFQSQQSKIEGIKSIGDLAVAHDSLLRLRCNVCLQAGARKGATPYFGLSPSPHTQANLSRYGRLSQKAQRVGQPKLALSK